MQQETHECIEKKTSTSKASGNIFEITKDEHGWVGRLQDLATEKVVYDGQADFVGQVLSECSLYLNYCPYCGEELNKRDLEKTENTSKGVDARIPKQDQSFELLKIDSKVFRFDPKLPTKKDNERWG